MINRQDFLQLVSDIMLWVDDHMFMEVYHKYSKELYKYGIEDPYDFIRLLNNVNHFIEIKTKKETDDEVLSQ